MIDRAMLNSVGLMLLTAAIAFLGSWFWFWRNTRELEARAKAVALADAENLTRSRITELEMKLVALTSAVTPLSAAMQAVLIKELTHYHTPELDALLVKVEDGSLVSEEEPRLFALLEDRSHQLNGSIPDSERDAATMLPMMMKRVKAERLLTAVDIQVVSLPSAEGESKPSAGK